MGEIINYLGYVSFSTHRHRVHIATFFPSTDLKPKVWNVPYGSRSIGLKAVVCALWSVMSAEKYICCTSLHIIF